MKVLHFVNENRLSWAEPYLQLISYLEDHGVDNIILCNPGGTLADKAKARGMEVIEYKPGFPAVPHACRNAGKLIEKISPDIIHTRLSSAALIGGYWGRKMEIPVVSTVDKYSKIKYLKYIDLAVAVSESVKAWIIDSGFDPERVQVIPNPVDVKKYAPDKDVRQKIRKGEKVEDREIVIAGAGRFARWKGFDVLVKAAGLLPPEKNYRLWLAGDGSEAENLKDLVRNNLSLEGRVEFWGFLDDIRPFLWASDIFVLPSRESEPFGLILLEAMASGLPVIATSAGGPLDMVEEDCGWLVPPDDPEKIYSVLLECTDRDVLETKGKAGLEKAALFDISRVGNRYYDLYDKLWGAKSHCSGS